MINEQDIIRNARLHSKEVNYNKEKEEAFIEGVAWAVKTFEHYANCNHGSYNLNASEKAYLDGLNLKAVKNFCRYAKNLAELSKEEGE